MKIVVNARFLTRKVTGVERFAIEISKILKKKYPEIVFVSPKDIVQNEIAELLEVKFVGNLKGNLWEQINLPMFLMQNGNPLLINFTNTAPIFYNNKIVTVHDISPLVNPGWYSKSFSLWYNLLIPLIVKYSHSVITVSNFSRDEIVNILGIESNKVHVIYNALPSNFLHQKISPIKEKYFLCVSSINPRKNFERIIDAFLKFNNQNYKLLIVGSKRNNFSNVNSFYNENVQFLGHVTDTELIELYRKSSGFIYVSLYEGFGIPILEAQSLGCPILVSNIPAHLETLQMSGLTCDPYNVDSIAEGMKELITLTDNIFIKRGIKNVERFSWDRSANKLVEVLSIIRKTQSGLESI